MVELAQCVSHFKKPFKRDYLEVGECTVRSKDICIYSLHERNCGDTERSNLNSLEALSHSLSVFSPYFILCVSMCVFEIVFLTFMLVDFCF